MASLSSLQDAKIGTIYDMNCNILTSIRYYQESPDTVQLIYSGRPVQNCRNGFF